MTQAKTFFSVELGDLDGSVSFLPGQTTLITLPAPMEETRLSMDLAMSFNNSLAHNIEEEAIPTVEELIIAEPEEPLVRLTFQEKRKEEAGDLKQSGTDDFKTYKTFSKLLSGFKEEDFSKAGFIAVLDNDVLFEKMINRLKEKVEGTNKHLLVFESSGLNEKTLGKIANKLKIERVGPIIDSKKEVPFDLQAWTNENDDQYLTLISTHSLLWDTTTSRIRGVSEAQSA